MQPTIPGRYLKLEKISKLSRDLSSDLPVEDLLQTIVSHICELTLSKFGAILLYEEQTGLLKFVAATHLSPDKRERLRIPLENSVSGLAFSTRKPVNVINSDLDPNIYHEAGRLLGIETRSVAAIPIIFRDQPLGVLEAVNRLGDSRYSSEDVLILETLAAYTGVLLFTQALLDETEYARREIEDLERMKSDFIAVTSHELRTPLGLILGHASSLSEVIQEPQHNQQLEVIVRNARRLGKIIADLTNVNQEPRSSPKLRLQPVSLHALINKACQPHAELAHSKNIRLRCTLPEQDLLLNADENKLLIAIGNLVENALRFTAENGNVSVLAEVLPGYVKISISDDGIGIPAVYLPRVFDRFFQVESHFTRKFGGLGLGLSVAKVMVEVHDGQIWAESQEGVGSTFSMLLPAGQLQNTSRKVPAFEI